MVTFGNTKILNNYKIAFFCSIFCSPEKITKIYDWAIRTRDEGETIISGFHTPMEQDILKYLLKGSQPIIISPARSISNSKIPKVIQKAFDDKRILFLSPFEKKIKRQTKQTAIIRNEFVANLADEIVIGHAEPEGNLDSLIRNLINKKISFI